MPVRDASCNAEWLDRNEPRYTRGRASAVPADIHPVAGTALKMNGGTMGTDMVGWASAFVLVMTISRQVYSQWRSGSVEGVSKWLFIGQITASVGFTVYSYLVENWVFVFANFFILLTALVGQFVYLRNKRRASARK